MVNFHGCTLPRGWERTWPHLMSMEAVRGEECYIFDPKYPESAPGQNTILPFTRNAVGPMDYTPVGLSDNKHPHLTTFAHELALSVLFESGWVHFTDKAESYLELPRVPKEFLKQVPVAWDCGNAAIRRFRRDTKTSEVSINSAFHSRGLRPGVLFAAMLAQWEDQSSDARDFSRMAPTLDNVETT